ncbi:unnamed protein product [Peniophora sp. CBMAI 1063]|nr:unnamed protein product [Peniophora sp. CBMAI 1063]
MSASIAARTIRASTRVAPSVTARFNSTSSNHNNDPEVLEREKHRNLSKAAYQTSAPMDGSAPGWNEHLASDAEANVKADRHGHSSPQDLVNETVKHLNEKHSPDERWGATESSTYEREEVAGPLGEAAKKVHKVVKETVTELKK